jgi:ELWxxDGT repeat protein
MNNYLDLLQPILANFSFSDDFSEMIESIFGSQSPEAIELLRQEWSAGTWALPTVEVVSGAALNGAVGGYATETGKIYLSRDLLELGDSGLLTKILLEEYGHAVDNRLNGAGDSPGDEGELFAAMVLGLPLDSEELERIKTESDQGFLTLETGEVVAIEMATLVKGDIFTTINSGTLYLTNINGVLYFTANDGVNGYELWKSDGTAAGTVLVKDIWAGSSSSYALNLASVNGTLYFRANDGVNGYELWKSDGTAAGTVLVKDIRAGSFGSDVSNLASVNGILYFRATDGVNGYELWKSDGTAAGTVLVKDIRAGSSSSGISRLASVNGILYFTANDGVNGSELWKSDGTAAGTVLVKDIQAGSSNSGVLNLTSVNGTLYFTADDGVNGRKIWTTDGTSENTQIADMAVSPTGLVSFLDTLFFQAADPDGIGAGLQFLNLNSSPTDLALSSNTINENVAALTAIGNFSTTDPDAGNTFIYTLVSGYGDNAAFSISGGNQLTINSSPDYETKATYDIKVRTTDQGGLSYEKIFTIGINNLDEVAPNITSSNTATAINENSGANQLVYTVTSTDTVDIATGSTTYSLKNIGDFAAFTIDTNSGQVKLTGNPDYETKSSYNFTVIAKDAANNQSEKTVTLGINNLDEVAPTITSSNTATAINENSGVNQLVYTVTSTDTGDIATGSTTWVRPLVDKSCCNQGSTGNPY